MKQLNKEQQMAVRYTDGPLLVLAGPGSGKTAVLTEHIQYLIGEKHVMPEQILALTFSRKAAAEMRRRFLKNTGGEATFVTFGTFHSVFFSVLRQYDTRSRQIISPAEQIRLIRDVLRKSGQTEIDTDLCLQFLNRISFYKNTGKIPRSLSVPEEVFLSVHEQYRQSMQRSGLIDYDDMIGNCLCLLRENPLILRNLQDRYLHILVDEFQDCNEMQYDLLKLLSKRHGHLFAVGDDDQSIYAFRGARGQIMQQFLKDHPDCSTVNLIRNYRCAGSVIDVADRFIHCNSDRIGKPKQLPSKLRGAGTVLMLFAKDAYEEAVRVHEEICRLLAENTCKGSEIAILYRSEQCADFLEEYLQDHGKSCSRKRKNTFYAQTGVLETLSYLSLSQGDYARSRFYTVLNKPDRGLVRECIGSDPAVPAEMLRYYQGDHAAEEKIECLFEDLHFMRDLSPYAAIHYIFKKMGLMQWYDAWRIAGRKEELPDADTLLSELCERAKTFSTIRAFLNHAYASGMGETLTGSRNAKDGIILQTVHASKGLEYDTVFVIGLQEGLFPSAKAVTKEELQEERRLLYVAMTRARTRLYLCARGREDEGKRYSAFIEELKICGKDHGSPRLREQS